VTTMTSRARWAVLAAAALMALAFVLPLWRVELIAPQYPEGLGMLIRINGVDGIKPNDLRSINNLNHYIGMKAIEPDAIPELKFMPWILVGLVVGGAAVAWWGKKRPLYVYGALLGAVLVAGLYDYWRWGYDYGHDLDMSVAIIKIPGMTYQPPLIGSKKLLNFRATSWPASGGVALTLGAMLVAAAMVDGLRRRGKGNRAANAAAKAAALALVIGTAASCAGAGPREFVVNEDSCDFCRMTITDARYGAQVMLQTGKLQLFDSVDCLVGFVQGTPADAYRGVWVSDAAGGGFVGADTAFFLRGSAKRGPMGETIAFAKAEDAREAQRMSGGALLSWTEVRADTTARAER
jgi:copper chaperone NosL